MKKLQLAREIALPNDVVTQKINVLGQSGGGKTYLAMKLAELMLEIPALITAIDLVGVWSGLLSAADGLHPGFPVLVIGGARGHLPLNPNAGRLTADVVYDRDVSVVLDVSDLLAEDEEQLVVFLADFLEQLFLRHKRAKKRRHLFYEEAQEIFPETMSLKGHVRLRRIGTRLCKIGRNYGLGYTTITQEPQSTSKRILNQAGTLIAVRTVGELERKAISGTARSASTQGLDLMNVLPDLQTGEAMVWSPAWLKFAGKVHVLPKVTFDSSKTPDGDDEAVEPKVLAPVEVEQLRAAMASAVAEIEAEDPAALKRRVRQLEAELAARPPPAAPERVEVRVISDSEFATIRSLGLTLHDAALTLRDIDKKLGMGLVERRGAGVSTRPPAGLHPHGSIVDEPTTALDYGWPVGGQRAADAQTLHPITVPKAMVSAIVAAPKTVVLDAGDAPAHEGLLAALAVRGPLSIDRLAVLTGFAETGGGFRKALKTLREGGLVAPPPAEAFRGRDEGRNTVGVDLVAITESGRLQLKQLGAGDLVFDVSASVSRWADKLGPGPWGLVDVLSGVGSMSPSALAKAVAMSETGGGFRKNLKKLRGSGLVEKDKTRPVQLTLAARELLEGTARKPAKTHEHIIAAWREKLGDGPRALLDVIVARAAPASAERLAEALSMSASGGGFRKNLKKLRTLGLIIEEESGAISASPALWP